MQNAYVRRPVVVGFFLTLILLEEVGAGVFTNYHSVLLVVVSMNL